MPNIRTSARRLAASGWATDGLADATYGLYANNIDDNPNRSIDDITEPTFAGYAQKDLTAAAEAAVVSGSIVLPCVPGVFQSTATPGSAETIYGWFAVDGDGILLAMQALESPVTIAADGDFVDVAPNLSF